MRLLKTFAYLFLTVFVVCFLSVSFIDFMLTMCSAHWFCFQLLQNHLLCHFIDITLTFSVASSFDVSHTFPVDSKSFGMSFKTIPHHTPFLLLPNHVVTELLLNHVTGMSHTFSVASKSFGTSFKTT